MKSLVYKNTPVFIKSVLLTSQGWLVGGAVKSLLNEEIPRDWDIIVPSRELFQIVNTQLGAYDLLQSKINTFGGLKYYNDELSIDIWCEELSHFLMTANKFEYAFNLKRNILIKTDI